MFMIVMISISALADAITPPAGEERVTLGNDLSSSNKETVYNLLGVKEGQIRELIVTIDEERSYLEGKVPSEKIGSRSISSIYLKTLEKGKGITCETHNIDWATSEMYMAALMTAGINDAQIIVAAPFAVSGTAAMTGIYKAYEDITGQLLSEDAKDVATDELVLTADLSDSLGDTEATTLINELKKILAEHEDISDEELNQYVLDVAEDQGIDLTEDQISQIIALLRKLQSLDLDPEQLLKQAQQLQGTLDKLAEAKDQASGFFEKIAQWWSSFVEWLGKIF
jgi:Predicted secreted protein